ncbi:MAG: LLM class flavin-dependent oxidoreductase [Myxococcota bacterium]
MKLSVLDVLPIASDHSAADALRGAGDLAMAADRLGYERLWYAEHHGMGNIASTSPELLIAHIASRTSRIRLGAGGVMLPNHVPLRVVEQYRTLHALLPGRLDLGIGRAAGTDPLNARALRTAPGDRFPNLMSQLLAFERGAFPASHPFSRIRVTPEGVSLPPIWMLGSSGGSARMAGELGTGYAFAGHFSPTPAEPAVQAYRQAFEPSEAFPEPRVILALHVVCAATAEEAEELALPVRYALANITLGRTEPVLTPAEVRAKGLGSRDLGDNRMARLLIVGTPSDVRAAIEEQARRATADEVMVMTLSHDPAARIRSYELLADAFALDSPPGA